jgi:hypothetical protein
MCARPCFATELNIRRFTITFCGHALVYDLQRYHPEFAIAVVDQILEDIRIGMEVGHFRSRKQCSALKMFTGKYLQIQPAKNIVRQVSRGTIHVSRRQRVGHL